MLNHISRNIRVVAGCFLGLFMFLFAYVTYLHVYQGDFLAGHALNRRNAEAAKKIPRGQILDRHGVKIGYSEKEDDHYIRHYPYAEVFAHVIGYDSPIYGRAGIESSFNEYLTGLSSPEYRLGPISQVWQPKSGNTLVLTFDAELQKEAYRALGQYKGAVVVIAPKTGEILALVSKPSFDPNSIDEDWRQISSKLDSPLLNRAVQGMYPPGSIIKTMVAEAAISEKISSLKSVFICEGALKVGRDYTLPEANGKAHGKINLEEALAVSCNVTFGKIALELGSSRMAKTIERYGFQKAIGSEFQETGSRVPDFGKLTDGELAQTGIGQGPLLTTPMRMAMLAAAYANRGAILKPYMVSRVVSPEGSIGKEFSPEIWLKPVQPAISDIIGNMMETVVAEGTGTRAYIKGIRVAGKTGTAENAQGQPHAWFIGFAPANNPEVAIAVIVENAGAGGAMAAPIARQVILEALR